MNELPATPRSHASARGSARLLVVCSLLFTALGSASCAAKTYSRRADRAATRVLDERVEDTLGGRKETVVWPEEVIEETTDGTERELAEPEVIEHVSLARALSLGVSSNRDYLAQKENLLLVALSLVETRQGQDDGPPTGESAA